MYIIGKAFVFRRTYGVLAQLGEHLPYKQRVIGSSPIGPIGFADVAQLAEQLICNQQVNGSSPIIGLDMKMSIKYGWVPEWPKGADCKSVSDAFGGSNPPPSTLKASTVVGAFLFYETCIIHTTVL